MKKLLAMLMLAAAIAAPAAANAASLPKGLAGTWCTQGLEDENGGTSYGPTLETGSCEAKETALIFTPFGVRVKDEGYDDIVCRWERFESRVVKGVPQISFAAKCRDERITASGFFFTTEPFKKGMNLKWESPSHLGR